MIRIGNRSTKQTTEKRNNTLLLLLLLLKLSILFLGLIYTHEFVLMDVCMCEHVRAIAHSHTYTIVCFVYHASSQNGS